jgi:type II secretory pathway component PulM
MEKVRALYSDLQAWLQAASPRERRLLAMAAGGVLFFVILVTWGSFGSAIRKAQENLDEKQGDFEKIARLSAGYGAQEQERQMLEARLRMSPPALMSFVDSTTKTDGVDVGGMSDRGMVAGGQGKLKETSVEVNLSKVSLDKLLKVITDIERSPGVVKIRRLRVRKSFENKDVLDVSLTVSAWQGS